MHIFRSQCSGFFFIAYNLSQSSKNPDLYFEDLKKYIYIKCWYCKDLCQHDWFVIAQSGWQSTGSSNKSRAYKWNGLSEEFQGQSFSGVVIGHGNWREAKAFDFKAGEPILITGFHLIVTEAIVWKNNSTTKVINI